MLVFPRMLLPHDKSIDVKVLAQIYNNTTATYKFSLVSTKNLS